MLRLTRQRAAWFRRWRLAYLALLLFLVLQSGLKASIILAAHQAMLTGIHPWWTNVASATWLAISTAGWIVAALVIVVVNVSIAALGAVVSAVPDDLEVALPLGESIQSSQSVFRRAALLVIAYLQIAPNILNSLMDISESVKDAFFAYYLSGLQLAPRVEYEFLWGALVQLGYLLGNTFAFLGVLELHCLLNLRYRGRVCWERIVLPLIPLIVVALSQLGVAYSPLTSAQVFDRMRVLSYLVYGLVPLSVALVSWMVLRSLTKNELRRAIKRRG